MPLHDFKCRVCGMTDERAVAIADVHKQLHTAEDHIGFMDIVYLKAPLGFVQPDVCYTSPVDGRPITNYHEHIEELKRTDSVVYEPGIKQDQERNARKREEALESAVEHTVEQQIATMPARKREKLAAELEGGMAAEPARITPPQTSFRESHG